MTGDVNAGPAPMVRPGEGMSVEQVKLGPVRQQLQEGAYDLEQLDLEQLRAAIALGDLAIEPPDTAVRKGFRNAYASLIGDLVWPAYARACVDQVHTTEFDITGRSFLKPVSESLVNMTPPELIEVLACANEATLTHFICQQFVGGNIPAISEDSDKDTAYFEALRMQTDLGMYAGVGFDDRLPDAVGSPSKFISAGTRTLRTHIFPLATLIDEVTGRDGVRLSNEQHRRSFLKSLRKSITPYYGLTVSVAVESGDLLIDTEAAGNCLDPDSWVYNGDPDDLWVYPVPEMIAEANKQFGAKPHLAPQTGCPFFHSRIPSPDAPDRPLIPLPRSLPDIAAAQLDIWYYSVRS
jgi:hypothetical protein